MANLKTNFEAGVTITLSRAAALVLFEYLESVHDDIERTVSGRIRILLS